MCPRWSTYKLWAHLESCHADKGVYEVGYECGGDTRLGELVRPLQVLAAVHTHRAARETQAVSHIARTYMGLACANFRLEIQIASKNLIQTLVRTYKR